MTAHAHEEGRPLRILLLGPINSRHMEHLALALARRSHDVHVVGEFAPHLPRTDLRPEGVVTTALDPRPSVIPGLKVARRVWKLRRIIREFEPDVVHAHFVWSWGFFALAAGARPLVVSAWGSDILAGDRRARLLNRIVVRRAALILAECKDLQRRVQALGAAPRRTAIVNWGVELTRFTPSTEDRATTRARLGLGPAPMVLSPRELDPLYNPAVILEAFGHVLSAVPDAQLVFKHQRSDHPDLGPLPDPDRVRFVGGGGYEQMADYYRAADVCVSIPSTDSSPRSVWEAMACGCPCVVSDLPWVEDLIVAGRHALVVPIEARAVADAIVRVLLDTSHASEMSAAARALCEQYRDHDAEMDRLVELYRGLRPRHGGRGRAARVAAALSETDG